MRLRHGIVRMLGAGSLAACLVATGLTPAAVPSPVRAEVCSPSMTPALKTARRHLFAGTYRGTLRHPGIRRKQHTFDVERVFAGGDRVQGWADPDVLSEGQRLTLATGGCSEMLQLVPGRRYLVSLGWLGPLTSWYGVAWQLLPGGRVRLVREYRGERMNPQLARPTTVREVVALMRPTGQPAPSGLRDDQLTGTCPTSPASVETAVDPSPSASPAVAPGAGSSADAAPTWTLALQASGAVPRDAPCAFESVTAWAGGVIASAHAGARAAHRLTADWTTPDGQTWTRRDPADPATARAQGGPTVAYGTGLLRFGSDDGDLAVWSSADGAAWHRLPAVLAFTTPAKWLDLQAATSGERIVVRGTFRDRCGVLGCRERTWTWTSADGVAWSRTDPGPRLQPRPVFPVVGREGGFVALGDRRAVLTSADGIRWRRSGTLPDGLLLTGLFASVPGDAATYWLTLRALHDSYGTVVVSLQRSEDLRAWSEVVRSPATETWPPAVGTGPAGMVLAGLGSEGVPWVMTSPDGRTWVQAVSPPGMERNTQPAAAAVGSIGSVVVTGGQNLAGTLAWRSVSEAQGGSPPEHPATPR